VADAAGRRLREDDEEEWSPCWPCAGGGFSMPDRPLIHDARATLTLDMADEPTTPELDWIDTCDQDIAEEAQDILRDVLHEISLGSKPILIPPLGTTLGGPRTPIGQEEPLTRHRERVANLLVARRVLRSAQYFQSNSAFIEDLRVGRFEVRAVETTVRQVHGLLVARLRGGTRPSSPALAPPKQLATPEPDPVASPPTPRSRTRREAVTATFWRLWHDPVGSKVIAGAILVLMTAVLGILTGPCKRAPVPSGSSYVDSLHTAQPPSDTTRNRVLVKSHEKPPRSVARPQPRSGGAASTAILSWTPPPYTALKIRGLRTHPVEFKLWGDSVIVDAMMEPGDSTSQRWSPTRVARPLMKFEVYSSHVVFHPGKIDEWLQEGQWVVAEKDRAVFVVPKNRIMWKNLRLCPTVSADGASRYPLVQGKLMRKGDARCWYFWLKIDGSGGIVKSGWANDDAPPAF
jgi:hypothetical protein